MNLDELNYIRLDFLTNSSTPAALPTYIGRSSLVICQAPRLSVKGGSGKAEVEVVVEKLDPSKGGAGVAS